MQMGNIAMDSRTLRAAATILFHNLVKTLNNTKSTQGGLGQAPNPFVITQWDKEITQRNA